MVEASRLEMTKLGGVFLSLLQHTTLPTLQLGKHMKCFAGLGRQIIAPIGKVCDIAVSALDGNRTFAN